MRSALALKPFLNPCLPCAHPAALPCALVPRVYKLPRALGSFEPQLRPCTHLDTIYLSQQLADNSVHDAAAV